METTIPLQKLDAHGAGRVRDVATALAAAARKGGAEGEEQFWIGIAGAMDSLVTEHAEATGEPLPEPIQLGENTGGVDLSQVSAPDLMRGASFMVAAAERYHAEGFPELSDLLAEVGGVMGRNAAMKARPNTHSSNSSMVQ